MGIEADATGGDELYEAALDVVRRTHRASTSSLQRALRISYTRAARLIDRMEEEGIVGPPRGADPRDILINLDGEFPASPKGVAVSDEADVMVQEASAETSGQEDSFDSIARIPITPVSVPEDSMDGGFSVSRQMRTAIHAKFSALKEEMGTDNPSLLPWSKIDEKLRAASNLKTGGCVMPEFLNVGRMLLEKEEGASPFGKSMDELLRQEDFPCLLRFRDTPGICFSGESEGLVLQAQLCVLRLLLSIHPNYVNFTLIDMATMGEAMELLAPLGSVLKFSRVDQDNEIAGVLKTLVKEVGDRNTKSLYPAKHKWLWQYNEANPAIVKPYHIVMLASGKEGIRGESAELLKKLINGNACRAGVYFFLCDPTDVESNETNVQSREQIDAAWRSCQRAMGHVIVEEDKVEVSQEGWIDTRNSAPLADYRMECVIPPPDTLNAIQQRIIASGKSKSADIVHDLVSMSEADWWKQDSRKGLTVPIGLQSGAEIQNFVIGEGGIVYNALVGGTIGTGKTVLLHNLILGAARLYSPAELRMHLLDYKEGTEFACYRALPHIDNLSIGPNVEFGLDVLNELSKELERRGKAFKEADVSNLAAYREKTGLPMPRHLVVIDEFQVLWTNDVYGERAGTKMTDLVRRGRSFGISFVLSTQSLRGARLEADAKENLGLRICLRLPESDCYDFLSSSNTVAATFSKAGEAVYNALGGRPDGNVLFRSAYMSGSEIASIVQKLKELALAKGISVERTNIYEGDEFVPLSALSEATGDGFICVGRTTGIRPVPVGIPVDGSGFRVLAIVGGNKDKKEMVFQTLKQQFANMGVEARKLGDGSLKEETERWRRWNEGREPLEDCPHAYIVRDIDRLRDVRDIHVQDIFRDMICGASKGVSSLMLMDAARYDDLKRALNVRDSSALTGLLLLDEDAACGMLPRNVRLGQTQGWWTGPGMEDGRKVFLATRDN